MAMLNNQMVIIFIGFQHVSTCFNYPNWATRRGQLHLWLQGDHLHRAIDGSALRAVELGAAWRCWVNKDMEWMEHIWKNTYMDHLYG